MKLSDQQKIDIVNEYLNGDTNCCKLAIKYNVGKTTIWSLLKNRKIEIIKKPNKTNKYSLDENYFNIVDTEDKAYFLGLLYADGYNYEERSEILLQLQELDIDILKKFNFYLKSNKPLQFKKSKKESCQNSNRIAISSKKISKRLVELGCPQAKTFKLSFPIEEQVPQNLLRHFVRGYFDGDGSFGIYKIKNRKNSFAYIVSVTSTEEFCKGLQLFLFKELEKQYSIFDDHKMKCIKFGGRNTTYKFLDWLYKDANVFLERKYKKYIGGKNENLSFK